MIRSPQLRFTGIVALLAAASWGALCLGAVPVGPTDALRAIAAGPVSAGDGMPAGAPADAIVAQIRAPRIVAALLTGSCLAVAGCILQSVLRNPLASPFVVGTAAAAGFGTVLGIFLGLPHAGTLLVSFLLAAAGSAFVLGWSRVRGRLPTETVVLTGFGVGLLFSAGTGILQFLAREETQLREMVFRLLGGLWTVTWAPLTVHVPLTLFALFLAFRSARTLDLLSLGEDDARRLGLDVSRSRTRVLLLGAFLAALAVSLAGVVAFVGLVVPHGARRLFGTSHGILIPACAVGGALFVLLADTTARTAFLPHEIPLGIVTSLVGAPFFLVLLRAAQRESFL